MDVYGLFIGAEFQTQVWASAHIQIALDRNPTLETERFLAKVQFIARAGFSMAPSTVRHKSRGVYAIQLPSSLFRAYGFFHGHDRSHFIMVTCTTKRGQKMNSQDRARLDEAVRIKENSEWVRQFP